MEEASQVFNDAVVGKELTMPNHLQSYTLSSWQAAKQSKESDILFRIIKPTKGALIEALSYHSGVREVLLPSSLRYKVTAKHVNPVRIRGKDFRVIDLEIVYE